jgi:colanic acid/amylovoran biosynthesis glycosyltransferase
MPKISNQQQADRPEVIIFRNNLFRISEPFITEQAEHLRRYQPLYLGRLRFGDPPVEATSLALQDSSGWTTLPRIAWHTLTRDPAAYRRLLQRRRPALIHAHFGTDGVYALPLAQQLGLPLITTFHGFDATLLSSPAWMNYPLFRRRLARQGDLFLCVSSFIRDCVLALGFPEQRTLLHYTGIDCEAIRPRDPAAESPMIVHVARLVEMKGTAYLIRAFAALPQRHRNVALVIIGDGELNRMLRKLAGCLGVADRVQFRGALPHRQALEHIRNAAMLVLPSVHTSTGRVEGLGMVLLEAAATGVPVVASCRIAGPRARCRRALHQHHHAARRARNQASHGPSGARLRRTHIRFAGAERHPGEPLRPRRVGWNFPPQPTNAIKVSHDRNVFTAVIGRP